MYIRRAIEKTLRQAEKGFKSVLVTGARQCGKTTMLMHVHQRLPYLTFDDPVLRADAAGEPGLFFMNHRLPLLLDEVQYATALFPYIKMECDRSQKRGQILMTGSQQYRLMRDVSESLAGRVAILEMSCLSLRELTGDPFSDVFFPDDTYVQRRAKTVKKTGDIWSVIHRGGYPALTDRRVDWQTFFSSYVQTYIERDINDLEKVKDKLKFTRFLTAVAAQTGCLLNYTKLAEYADITPATAKEWISLLEASGIIYLLQPFSNSALRRAVKTPKLYFRDTGLACYLTRHQSPQTAMTGAMAGELFETFVVSEILKSYSNAGKDYRMYATYYRGRDKIRKQQNGNRTVREAEIDLLLEQDGMLCPVEIKMSANPSLSMTDAFDVLDQINGKVRGKGTVICMYPQPIQLNERNMALPVGYI